MNKRESFADVVQTVALGYAVLLLYGLAGKLLLPRFGDPFVGYFFAQALMVVFALGAVSILHKKAYLKPERECLGSEWGAAGFMIFVTLFLLAAGLGNLVTATVTPVQMVCFVGQVLLIGLGEEMVFRALIQRTIHAWIGEESRGGIVAGCALGGALFGGAHLFNALNAEIALFPVVFQASVACAMGMYLGAVYYRTGKNFLFLAGLHAAYDGAVFIASGRLNGVETTAIVGSYGSTGIGVGVFWIVVYVLLAFYLLRPSKVAGGVEVE